EQRRGIAGFDQALPVEAAFGVQHLAVGIPLGARRGADRIQRLLQQQRFLPGDQVDRGEAALQGGGELGGVVEAHEPYFRKSAPDKRRKRAGEVESPSFKKLFSAARRLWRQPYRLQSIMNAAIAAAVSRGASKCSMCPASGIVITRWSRNAARRRARSSGGSASADLPASMNRVGAVICFQISSASAARYSSGPARMCLGSAQRRMRPRASSWPQQRAMNRACPGLSWGCFLRTRPASCSNES